MKRLVNKTFKTVGELVDILSTFNGDYKLSPLGVDYPSMAINTKEKRTFLDDEVEDMLNDNIKAIEDSFETVAELMEILVEIPYDFAISPYGEEGLIFAISNEEKRIYMDKADWLVSFVNGEEM